MRRQFWCIAVLWGGFQQGLHAAELPGLVAERGSPADAKELAGFGRLVGSWDLDVVYHHEDGRIEHRPGEWHFSWILEGRAIQDVWHVPAVEPGAAPRVYGTTIRAWDPELGAWRVTWVSGLSGGTTSFIASAIAGEIVMESQGEEQISRWIFSDITPDGGRNWLVVQEMSARRRQAGGR